MTQGTLVSVKGVVIELKGTKTGTARGRSWKRYDFLVKQLTGQIATCNTFGAFDKDLIGKTVQFEAEFNERYSNYAVKSDIEVLEDADVEEAPEPSEPSETTETPKRRGRPKKNATSKVAPVLVKQRTVESDLESVREDAVQVFEHDVDDVSRILSNINHQPPSEHAIAVGVQALQAIRATLFIESNKRERVTAMHGR